MNPINQLNQLKSMLDIISTKYILFNYFLTVFYLCRIINQNDFWKRVEIGSIVIISIGIIYKVVTEFENIFEKEFWEGIIGGLFEGLIMIVFLSILTINILDIILVLINHLPKEYLIFLESLKPLELKIIGTLWGIASVQWYVNKENEESKIDNFKFKINE